MSNIEDGEGKAVKKAHWVLDGPVMEDTGDVGGDIQVGPAVSARFRSDDCPGARFEVAAYATAKLYSDLDEPMPDCPHSSVLLEDLGNGVGRFAPMSEEHMACSWKPGTVDVQAQYTYRMNGHVDECGNYESDDTDPMSYEWVGSDLGYPGETLSDQIRAANLDAKRRIADWVDNVNKYLHWDGRTRPND